MRGRGRIPRAGAGLALALAACAPARSAPPAMPAPAPAPARAPEPGALPVPAPVPPTLPETRKPIAPPATAFFLGLMPVRGTGLAPWRVQHPAADGRGVLIGILDSGVDPSVPGLLTTTTGLPKILDLRNFSGEGDVALERVWPDAQGRIALPGGLLVGGAAAVKAVAADTLWYGGVIDELAYGDAPAADFNGNGSNRDRYGVVVVRTAAGWVAFIDTNGDGSLADETPLTDYLVRRQTFTFGLPGGPRGAPGPITGAVNLSVDGKGRPRLSLVLDTAGHGTHVAGIAAGNDIGGVQGFDGVAPGAQILGLKIADNARGGISTTGSMARAMAYAAEFAAQRHLPLVLNMSFGVGNMEPGAATMDSIVDAFLLAHPDVVFAISAGNDGPGTETMGEPGSASLALAVGAVYPGVFAPVQFGSESPDVLGWWSSRGGALDKPDVVTPGMAYSTVPRWNTGEEIKAGTSMSSPYAAGLAADLLSAELAAGRTPTAAQLEQALRLTARSFPGETEIDDGYGMPQLEAAYQWLQADHHPARYLVRALPPLTLAMNRRPPAGARAGATVVRAGARPSAAYRRDGLTWAGDTVQVFDVTRLDAGSGDRAGPATFQLTSDAAWLVPTRSTVTMDAAGTAEIEVHYNSALLAQPGRYVASVSAIPVSDSAAGPAFRLVNEITIPDSLSWGAATLTGQALAPGRAWRYYVNVPPAATGLAFRLTVADTSTRAALELFEPSGRPARSRQEADIGGREGAVGTVAVTDNDLSPGVWEAVVQAFPGESLQYAFAASVPPIALPQIDSGTPGRIMLLSESPRDTTLAVTADRIGMVSAWQAVVEDGGPYRRRFLAPSWATRAVLEVQLTPGFWNTVTDFGLTMYDPEGAQLGNSPMNYDFNRLTVDLPAKRQPDYAVTVELFPAFALPQPPASFPAIVRVAFLGPALPIPLGAGQDTAQVQLPPHGVRQVVIPAFPALATAPPWRDLVRLRIAGREGDWDAIVREISVGSP
jgi:tripeptidyl-peptidase-2